MSVKTIPSVYYQGRQLKTSPDYFGELRDSRDIAGNTDALQARMLDEGYLYLPGLLDVDKVMAARRSILERLHDQDSLDPDSPLMEGIIKPGVSFSFRPDLANGNPEVHTLLYTSEMLAFFNQFLGGPVLHFDYTWLRAKAPGPNTATQPHCDIVFMNRGTKRLYTAWTPLGDVSYELGGLIVLEGSHHKREVLGDYWEFDVDTYCVDSKNDPAHDKWSWSASGGAFSKDAIGVRQTVGGRWLSADYKAGDLLVFDMFTLHASLDNQTNRVRLSTDSRYQLASEAADERWMGEQPIAHGAEAKRGLIC